ncbi:hypothetical protein F53441_1933 [Fusarium austroafricanum]|uniref:LDB19 N-terminal domain-containing protein n=1 Tax=Fusarium austroafricanum TaxID=2364996 RepID=A0A8H4KU47_9HYPO|nr:hypothetical protein F53441_1933 [Fusarium austroafricanum]
MTSLSQLIRPQSLAPPLFKQKPRKSRNNPPASLHCRIDTSPIVILNNTDSSDSSTISGSLLLEVTEDVVEVDSLHAVLRVHAVNKKPFKRTCRDCKHQITDLERCHFIKTTTTLDRNTYEYPFSYRVPSYVPPSMDTSLVSVTYEFEAVASIQRKGQLSRIPEIVKLDHVLPVVRSIPVPNKRSRSSRIYQSAGVEVSCSFDPVMDPSRSNQATLTMSGLRSCPGNGEDVHFWRVCKGTWILEETVKTTALACPQHTHEGKDGNGHAQKKTSILGESSFYDGWTTDDDAGMLNMAFPFSVRKSSTRYTQDTGDVGDTSVTHGLILELQFMKETYPKGKSDLSSTGGKAPRKVLIHQHPHREFQDHAGGPYNLITDYGGGPNATIFKLSIQLYCLGKPKYTPREIGEGLLRSDAIRGWGNARNHWPRIDVYTGFETVEECIEHHRREKAFRKEAVEEMKRDAVGGLSGEEAEEKLASEVAGKEPLPHIVPSWCQSARFAERRSHSGGYYRSWILVVPKDRDSWDNVVEKGLIQASFDLEVSPAMFTDEWDEFEESGVGKDGWVLVDHSGIDKLEAVEIRHLCAREQDQGETPGSDKRLFDAWVDATTQLRDCCYKPTGCDDCADNEPHDWCEQERDEHYYDEDGQCIACRRQEEYRRRSKRIRGQKKRPNYKA